MPRFIRALATLTVIGGLVACGAPPSTDTGHEVVSAAVTVMTPVHGSMPRIVVAWGEVSPGPSYQQTVAVAAEGALVSLGVAQGEHVTRGQVLGHLLLSGSAKIAAEQAATSLKAATVSLERARRLRKDELATDEQVILAEKTVRDAKAAAAVLPATDSDGKVAVASPVEGSVAAIVAAPGQVVPANSPLLSITPSSRLTLACGAEPRSASVIHVGMQVMMTPVDGGDAIAGTVTAVGEAIDAQTHLIPVRVAPSRPPMAGSAWRADITVGSADGWIVPVDAVIDEGDAHFVYQVHDGKARRVPVTILAERDGRMSLNGAIDASSPLVIAGAPQLSDGMTVATSEGGR